MKKILFIMTLLAGVFSMAPAVAQTDLKSASYGNTLDTVTNTGTKVLFAKVTGYKETITVIVDVTKISGTLGGTLTSVVSRDGVKWYTGAGVTTGDSTFTVTDVAAQGKVFNLKKGFQYYGVQWTGTGTMSGSFSATLLARKPTD